MKGQLSAEMIILLAVILAIVALAASYLLNLAQEGGKQGMETGEKVLKMTNCSSDSDCPEGYVCGDLGICVSSS